MINFNLSGDALLHCVKISGAKIILVDQNEKCLARINAERDKIQNELGIKIIILSQALKNDIGLKPAQRPDNSYRDAVTGKSPVALFYTRYFLLFFSCYSSLTVLSAQRHHWPP